EAQSGGLVAMRGGELARIHHLYAGVQQAGGRAPFLAARVYKHHHASRRLLGGDKIACAAHEALDTPPFPQCRHRFRLRIPRLDLVRHGPERAERLAFAAAVVRLELGRVLDVGAADNVFALHAADSSVRTVMRYSIQCMRASAIVLSAPKTK